MWIYSGCSSPFHAYTPLMCVAEKYRTVNGMFLKFVNLLNMSMSTIYVFARDRTYFSALLIVWIYEQFVTFSRISKLSVAFFI